MLYLVRFKVKGDDGVVREFYDGFDRRRGVVCSVRPALMARSRLLCAYANRKTAEDALRQIDQSFVFPDKRGIESGEVIAVGIEKIKNHAAAMDNAATRYYLSFCV